MILIVEDDPTLRLVTEKGLDHLGYSCVAVATGEEAVKKNLAEISLILMDIGLPGMDGIDTTKLIREKENKAGKKRRIPIVALTAHSTKEQCISAGMDDFLQKPALISDLKRVADRWLKRANE
jgi:CheY-like chemotaxis protein